MYLSDKLFLKARLAAFAWFQDSGWHLYYACRSLRGTDEGTITSGQSEHESRGFQGHEVLATGQSDSNGLKDSVSTHGSYPESSNSLAPKGFRDLS